MCHVHHNLSIRWELHKAIADQLILRPLFTYMPSLVTAGAHAARVPAQHMNWVQPVTGTIYTHIQSSQGYIAAHHKMKTILAYCRFLYNGHINTGINNDCFPLLNKHNKKTLMNVTTLYQIWELYTNNKSLTDKKMFQNYKYTYLGDEWILVEYKRQNWTSYDDGELHTARMTTFSTSWLK